MSIADLPKPLLRLSIDSGALAANWQTLDRLSGAAAAGAAVKADAYGVGVAQAVPALLKAGAREFFVAHWGEVPAVLEAGVPAQNISVLHGVATPEEAAFARSVGVRPVINSIYQAKLWHEAGGAACNVMLDSGINRLGISPDEVGEPVLAALDIDILLSHLASAEEETDFNAQQLRVFAQANGAIPAKRRSLANSAGIALGPDYHFDLTRPGLALYGGVPCDALAGHIQPVVSIQAAIMQMRDLKPGDTVGYNGTFTATGAMRVATVSLGYADGILRCWAGNGALQHSGRSLPLLGRVSMDMVVVDCSAAPELKEGDFLDFPYALPAASQASGLSQYELLTILGHRFEKPVC